MENSDAENVLYNYIVQKHTTDWDSELKFIQFIEQS
jgi:hypothetical protein